MKNSTFVAALIFHLAFVSAGYAQKELGSEVQLGLSNVLKYNGVAKDLDLTDEQNEKLFGLWVEVETKLEYAFQDYRENYSPRFSKDKQKELVDELQSKIKEIRDFEMERLNDALIPQQVERLKQIRFQILKRNSDGLQGLEKELSLTKDQISKIKGVRTDYKKTMLEMSQYAREEQLTPNEIKEELAAIRKESEEKLLEVLTSTQRSKLKRLEGEPFVVQTGKPKKEDDK